MTAMSSFPEEDLEAPPAIGAARAQQARGDAQEMI